MLWIARADILPLTKKNPHWVNSAEVFELTTGQSSYAKDYGSIFLCCEISLVQLFLRMKCIPTFRTIMNNMIFQNNEAKTQEQFVLEHDDTSSLLRKKMNLSTISKCFCCLCHNIVFLVFSYLFFYDIILIHFSTYKSDN